MSGADDKKWVWLFLKIGGGILVLWCVSAFTIVYSIDASDRRAEFGDMFGAVNALFSGLAFAGLMVTIWMQKEDLRIQQEEIKKQNETLARQQFEATFFQMLKLFDERRKSVKFGEQGGSRAFDTFRTNALQKLPNGRPDSFHIIMKEKDYEQELGPYLRQYENLCRLTAESRIALKDIYWRLLRDLLSGPEAILILFYASSIFEHSKRLKMIIEDSGLLLNINQDEKWNLNLADGWNPDAFKEIV